MSEQADYYAIRGRGPRGCWVCDRCPCKCKAPELRRAKRGAKQQWQAAIADEIEDYYQSQDWTIAPRVGSRPVEDHDLQAWIIYHAAPGPVSFAIAFRAARASGRQLTAVAPGVYRIA